MNDRTAANKGKSLKIPSLTSPSTTTLLTTVIISLIALSFVIHGQQLTRLISIATLLMVTGTQVYRYTERRRTASNRARKGRKFNQEETPGTKPRFKTLKQAITAAVNILLTGLLLLIITVYIDAKIV